MKIVTVSETQFDEIWRKTRDDCHILLKTETGTQPPSRHMILLYASDIIVMVDSETRFVPLENILGANSEPISLSQIVRLANA